MTASTSSLAFNIPATAFTPYTPLEGLLLFHYLSTLGTHPGIFSLVSGILNKNPLVLANDTFDCRRLSPDALRKFYEDLHRLAAESANVDGGVANDVNSADGEGPIGFDTARFTADMKEIFFLEYKNMMIRLIKADEEKYSGLENDVKEIKSRRLESKVTVNIGAVTVNTGGGLQASDRARESSKLLTAPLPQDINLPKLEVDIEPPTAVKLEQNIPPVGQVLSSLPLLPPIQLPEPQVQTPQVQVQPVIPSSSQQPAPSVVTSPPKEHVQSPPNQPVQPAGSPPRMAVHPAQRPQPPALQPAPLLPPLPPMQTTPPMHSPPLQHSSQHMVPPSTPIGHYSPPIYSPISAGHSATSPKPGHFGPVSPPQFNHQNQAMPAQQTSHIDQQRPKLPSLLSSPIGQSSLSAYKMQSPGHQQSSFNQIILPMPTTHPQRIPLNLSHPPQSPQILPIVQPPIGRPSFPGQFIPQQLGTLRTVSVQNNQLIAQPLQPAHAQPTQALPPQTAQVQHTTQTVTAPQEPLIQQSSTLPSSAQLPVQAVSKPRPPPIITSPLPTRVISGPAQPIVATLSQSAEERPKTPERRKTPDRPEREIISPITPSHSPGLPDYNEVSPEQFQHRKRPLEDAATPAPEESVKKPDAFLQGHDDSPQLPEPKRMKSITTLDSIPMPPVTPVPSEEARIMVTSAEKAPIIRSAAAKKAGIVRRGSRSSARVIRGKTIESDVAIEAEEDAIMEDAEASPSQSREDMEIEDENGSSKRTTTRRRPMTRRASLRISPTEAAESERASPDDAGTNESALAISPRDTEIGDREEEKAIASEVEGVKTASIGPTLTPKAAAAAQARLAKQAKRKRASSIAREVEEPSTPVPTVSPTLSATTPGTCHQAPLDIELAPPPALEKSESSSSLSTTTFPPPTPPAVASAPPTSAPVVGHQTKIVATKKFTQLTNPILTDISGHRFANIFAAPVNEKVAPGYNKMIYRPTDLKTIKTAIKNGVTAVNAAMAVAQPQSSEPATPASTSFASSSSAAFHPQTPLPATPSTPVAAVFTAPSGDRILPSTTNIVPPKGIINTAQLEKELFRMLANAIMYNKSNTEIAKETAEMAKEVDTKIANFRNAERAGEERGRMRGETPFGVSISTPVGTAKGLRGKGTITPALSGSVGLNRKELEHINMLNLFGQGSPIPKEKKGVEGLREANSGGDKDGDGSKETDPATARAPADAETENVQHPIHQLSRDDISPNQPREEVIPDSQPSPLTNTKTETPKENLDQDLEQDGEQATSPAGTNITATAETPASTTNFEGEEGDEDGDAEEMASAAKGMKRTTRAKRRRVGRR